MFSLSVQNENGDLLELTHNPNYIVKHVGGLTPMSATINTSTYTNFDGARYNSSRANMRNLVLSIMPRYTVDENRINLYQYFKSGRWVRIFYKNSLRNVYIDGYVETNEGDLFEKGETLVISIICPQPYFVGLTDETEETFKNVVPLFEGAFSIPEEGITLSEVVTGTFDFTNKGDVPYGMIFKFSFTGNVVDVTIRDNSTDKTMVIEYECLPYDTLNVNTNKGEKSILLYREGEEYNLINYLTDDSEWLEARTGQNSFTVSTVYGDENYTLDLAWSELFEGV